MNEEETLTRTRCLEGGWGMWRGAEGSLWELESPPAGNQGQKQNFSPPATGPGFHQQPK